MEFSFPSSNGEGRGQMQYFQRLYEAPPQADPTASLADENQLLHRGLLFMLEEVHRLRGSSVERPGALAVAGAPAAR